MKEKCSPARAKSAMLGAVMRQILIHLGNGAWLVLVFIGVPVITSRQWLGFSVGSASDQQILTFGGLGLALGLNLAGVFLIKGQKAQAVCRNWALIHAGLFVLEILLFKRRLHFNWLADFLLWLKKRCASLF